MQCVLNDTDVDRESYVSSAVWVRREMEHLEMQAINELRQILKRLYSHFFVQTGGFYEGKWAASVSQHLFDTVQVTPSAHFQKDLGLDSLDTVEVVMAFEEEFAIEIPDSEADKILSTADAISYVAAHPQAK